MDNHEERMPTLKELREVPSTLTEEEREKLAAEEYSLGCDDDNEDYPGLLRTEESDRQLQRIREGRLILRVLSRFPLVREQLLAWCIERVLPDEV